MKISIAIEKSSQSCGGDLKTDFMFQLTKEHSLNITNAAPTPSASQYRTFLYRQDFWSHYDLDPITQRRKLMIDVPVACGRLHNKWSFIIRK